MRGANSQYDMETYTASAVNLCIVQKSNRCTLLLFLCWLCRLGLFGATDLFRTILALVTQLPRRLFDLGHKTGSDQSVLGLKLSLHLFVVVDEPKASRSSTTKDCSEAIGDYTGLVGLVRLC